MPDDASAAPLSESVTPGRKRARRLRRTLAIALLVLVLAYLAVALLMGRNCPLLLVSGLGVPYEVTVAGQTYTLEPGQVVATRVREGQVPVAVQDDALGAPPVAVEVRTSLWLRPLGRPLLVLNPDAAAVLVRETLRFPAPPAVGEPQLSGSLHTGLPLYAFPQPDAAFAEIPQELTSKAKGKGATLTRVTMFPPDVPPLQLMEAVTHELGLEAAVPLAVRRLMARPEALDYLQFLAAALKPEGLALVLKPGLAARPVRIEWHRAYQGARQATGADEDVVEEYRAFLADEPANADLQYLLGRVVPTAAESMQLFQQSTEGDAPCPHGYHALALKYLSRGDFGLAVEHSAKATALASEHAGFMLSRTTTLMAAGQTEAALEELRRLAAASPGDASFLLEIVQLRAAQGGMEAAEQAITEWLDALNQQGVPPEALAEVAPSMRTHAAYVVGDLERFAAGARESGEPNFLFAEALTAGRLEEAEEALAKVQPPNPLFHLLLCAAALRADLPELADRQLTAATEPLHGGYQDQRLMAEMLAGDRPFVFAELDDLARDQPSKAAYLTVLGLQHPDQREACFELARKLNFRRLFPPRFLADIVGQAGEP